MRGLTLGLSKIVGSFVRNVALTKGEVTGLMSDLLISDAPSVGNTSFKSLLTRNVDALGERYAFELDRHYRR